MAGESVREKLVHLSNIDEGSEGSILKTATKPYTKRWGAFRNKKT